MKEVWKRTSKIFVRCCILFAVLTFALFAGNTRVQAASTKTKALKAYSKLLSQKNLKWSNKLNVKSSKCKFALIYVDNNSVPELFVDASGAGTNHVSGFYKLYTYRDGKVKDVCTMRDAFGYYKKKGVFVTATLLHGEYITYHKLSSGKSSVKLRSETYYSTSYYNGSGKKISKSSFNKTLKSLVGSTKKIAPVCRKNTKTNRTKYLK